MIITCFCSFLDSFLRKVEEILKNEDRKLRDLTDKLNTIVDEKKEVTFAK